VSLEQALRPHVESGSIPGLTALVAHGTDVVDVAVLGTPAADDPTPLQRDAIFRIASISKPIVAVLTMALIDDGVLRLDDRVDTYLPELADRRVLTSIGAPLDDTVPAERPLTVEDLLSFRLGFGTSVNLDWGGPGLPIQQAERELGLATLGPPWPPPAFDGDEWIRRFATLPLMAPPGEEWMYNTGLEVLGVLLEHAAAKPLPELLDARLCRPLGMVDTAFHVPAQSLGRLTTAYTGDLAVLDRGDASSWWATPPALSNAAGWLVSTLDDLWCFARMMVAGGVVDGERFLSPTSFDLSTTNRLTEAQRRANTLFLGAGGGWGLGMATPLDGRGGFGWDGGTGTSWRTDPSTGVTGILLTQRAFASPEPPPVVGDFWAAAR
jgi:CubicO group peptidase (beta-lactamase class C family)